MKNLFRKLVPLFLVVSLVFTMGAQSISAGDGTENGEEENLVEENIEEIAEEVEENFDPSLTLNLSTDKATYKNGETVSYQIKIKNDGDVDLEKVDLKDGLNDRTIIGKLKVNEEKVIVREFKINSSNDLEQLKNKVEAKAMFENEEVKDEASFVVAVEKEAEEQEEQKEPEEDDSEEEASEPEENNEDLEEQEEPKVPEEDEEQEEPKDGEENNEEIDKDGEEKEEVEDELAENYPPVKGEPDIALPDSFYQKNLRTMSNGGLEDTIEVNKQAERIEGCRTFEVTLDITGEPQEAPVDVVLVIDRSGSMNEKIGGYWTNPRLYYAKKAAVNFAGRVLGSNGIPGSRVSVVSFSGPQYTSGSGDQNQASTDLDLSTNLTTVTNTINGITATGGTNTEAGFKEGQSVIQGTTSNQNPNSNKVVIMLTDGLPTVSNGNQYQETTNINHIHIQRAIVAGQNIYQNSIADVFTIGLTTGMSSTELNLANNILTQAQNKGYYNAPTAQDLDQIFNDISTQLGYAATDAVVVDKIGDNFELVDPNNLPSGASYDANTREITWEPGTIVEEASLTYEVVAKDGFTGGLADTNEYATLTYTDVFGNEGQEKDFPVPEVDVPTLLEVSLTDATITVGDSISLGIGTDPSGENYMSDITGGDGDENYSYEWRIAGESNVISTDENPSVNPTEDTEYELTVIDSNGCIALATMTVFVEEVRTDFGIKKIDGASEELLDGAKFVLKKDGEEIDTDDTVSGYAWMRDLLPGTYTLEETVAPDGYKDNEQVYTVVIDEEGNITVDPELIIEEDDGMQVIVVENELLEFDIGIKKIDLATEDPLDGAKFILKKDGQEITTVETASGYAWLDGLVAGTYTLEEVKAPDGYRLDDTVYEIVIDEEGNITTDPILTIIEEDGKQLIVLMNKPKTDLPQTGGPGSLVFSLLGISLIAVSYMGYKKRYN